ncbi:MAG: hypothetical protein HY245_12140 [Rhizobiales bacterium]|nr:hypothetical protein [Hyphomicrobiales bacterium]MBI3674138.1 hypothetical protein [Hyphomicrobiales bacterium]
MPYLLLENLNWLIDAIIGGLAKSKGEGVDTVLARLAGQRRDAAALVHPVARSLPVTHYLSQCIAETMLLDARLAAALAAVEPHLQWCRSIHYTDALLGEGFVANYGWCELVGPRGFFPGEDFLLGLLMLGPGRHYRDHYHPAPELYWPLTSGAEWRKGSEDLTPKSAGSTIWHAPNVVHATRTQDKPLLALWCWTSDTATPAKLVAQA